MRSTTIHVALALAVLASCGGEKKKKPDPASAAKPADPKDGGAGPRAKDASRMHLELGLVYERFGDRLKADAEFARAAKLARSGGDKVTALSARARISEANGQVPEAIKQLERALSAAKGADGSTMPVDTSGLRLRLAKLYAWTGNVERAELAVDQLLEKVRDPGRLDELLRQKVSIFQQTEVLDERIARIEKALAKGNADEQSLRLLVLGYEARAAEQQPSADPTADPKAAAKPSAKGRAKARANATKVVRAYEALAKIRPDDAGVRERLIAAYERAGQVSKAVALLDKPVQPRAGGGAEDAPSCDLSISIPARVSTVESAVNMLLRAGKRAEAERRVNRLAAQNGAAAAVTAARLYRVLGKPARGRALLLRAQQRARTPEQRRRAAVALAEYLTLLGDEKGLEALLAGWQRGADSCLKSDGKRRAAELGARRKARAADPEHQDAGP